VGSSPVTECDGPVMGIGLKLCIYASGLKVSVNQSINQLVNVYL